VNLFGGNASIADRCGAFGFTDRDRTKAQDRARCADDAIETHLGDFLEVFVEFGFDVLDEFAFVARGDRIALDESLGEADDADLEASSEIDRGACAARDLHAAAADVNDDPDFARETKTVCRRKVNEPRFLGPRDHPGPDAGLADDRVKEFATVLGFANGAGGPGNDVIDLMGSRETAELREDLQSQAHSLRRKGLSVEAPGAEPHHLLLSVNDLK
jgi:hypothetical protein